MSYYPGNFALLNVDYIAEHSLCIHDLGLEYRKNEYYYYENSGREYHGYLFQFTLDGYGIYESQGIRYKLTKGKAFLITFPEDSKYYLSSEEINDNHWTFFYLHFSGPAVEPFFHRIKELSGPVIELPMDSLPVSLFFELYENLRSKQTLDRYLGSEWLYRFLISLLRNVEFPATLRLSPHVSAAIEWIKNNYTRQINLELMSLDIGVTYSHLTRQFVKEQGITPSQFLTHVRLEHGMQLLLNTDYPIEKIAEECGFSCANYFTKVYKKVMHMTPAQYRRQHKLYKMNY